MLSKGNAVILAIGVIGIVIIYLGWNPFGEIDPTFFEGITGFSLIDIDNARLECDAVGCIWHFRSLTPALAGGILKEEIDLALINTNEPIIVDWKIITTIESFTCETFQKNFRLVVSIDDEEIKSFATNRDTPLKTNIQPVLANKLGLLELGMGGNFCTSDIQGLRYSISNGNGTESAKIKFTKAGESKSASEIEEDLTEIDPLPEICPQLVDQVCGIDGRTYANRCFAGEAGVMVEHTGRCEADIPPPPPEPEPTPEPTPEPEDENGFNFPEFVIGQTSSIVFVVVGIIMVVVVGIAIYVRRRNAQFEF